MKNCVICDICRRKLDFEEYRIQKKRPFRVIKRDPDWDFDILREDVDLCPACWKALVQEIRNRSEKTFFCI